MKFYLLLGSLYKMIESPNSLLADKISCYFHILIRPNYSKFEADLII